MIGQGQDLQGPPEPRTKPKMMKTWPTYSASWEGAVPCDQEHPTRDFFSIITYFHFIVMHVTVFIVIMC